MKFKINLFQTLFLILYFHCFGFSQKEVEVHLYLNQNYFGSKIKVEGKDVFEKPSSGKSIKVFNLKKGKQTIKIINSNSECVMNVLIEPTNIKKNICVLAQDCFLKFGISQAEKIKSFLSENITYSALNFAPIGYLEFDGEEYACFFYFKDVANTNYEFMVRNDNESFEWITLGVWDKFNFKYRNINHQ